jgi:capsular polysaccharide biosynthesis protein
MELRQYWRVLVRRRAVVRNTFLLVALLAVLSVGYSYYNGRYLGKAKIGVQVQPNMKIRSLVGDPQEAANLNSDSVVGDLTTYASGRIYFESIAQELRQRYHFTMDWRTLQLGTKVYPVPNSHIIYIQLSGSNEAKVGDIITAAVDQLRAWAQVYHATLLPNTPAIDTVAVDPPKAQLLGLSTPLADFLLRAALGLVAGLILAYLFEYLDDTVQDEADVQYWLGLPTLAVIPGRRSRLRSA